ncbi:SagB/ThcOx family dehydrogenase [Paenibacillus sp. LC-T2]|uniref:SagB/ThcOx family dehydrogenase n=2 Tax=Paenibacillus monticola TaxID=2666075 RepID=A0A7X2L545_9BACL|nr:SagB/ThcOx family dehydrogenase [Paenibacillus monticola]
MDEEREKIYYWKNDIRWNIEDGILDIESRKYKGFPVSIFSQLYHDFLKGKPEGEMEEYFSQYERRETRIMKLFVQDLIANNLLVSAIAAPQELFQSQYQFIKDDYPDHFFLVKENVEEYVEEKQRRFDSMQDSNSILHMNNVNLPDVIHRRASTRRFDVGKKVSMQLFNNLMSSMCQKPNEENITYYYPSAGGLYPINIYVFVKEGRVEGVSGGLYILNPAKHALVPHQLDVDINSDAQYFTNKEIAKGSAFTIYFTYDGEVNMQKYKGQGYYYGILETGILMGLVSYYAEYLGLGSCIIGDLEFRKIEPYFKLKTNEVYMQSIELGMKVMIP